MICTSIGSFIAFPYLLNHNNPHRVMDIEQDAVVSDTQSETGIVVPERSDIARLFRRDELINRLGDPSSCGGRQSSELPNGFRAPFNPIHKIKYKFLTGFVKPFRRVLGAVRHSVGIAVMCLALAGCAIRGTEIPDNDAAGSDAMKVSPCACAQIEHQAPEFTWIG